SGPCSRSLGVCDVPPQYSRPCPLTSPRFNDTMPVGTTRFVVTSYRGGTMSTQQAQATQAIAGRARWEIDPVHSEIGFAVRHMMVATARGRFGEFSGHVDFDPAEPTGASVEVSINAKSIDTRNPDRDAHLRSPDFFDAENHPTITFKSRRIEAVGGDQYRVIGDLTIRGVTRE